MFNIFYLIRELDVFSVPFSPAIDDKQQFYHKSILGGVFSLVVLVLSAIYAIIKIIGWREFQLLPKVTQQFQPLSEQEILQAHKAQISFKNVGYTEDYGEGLDPFDPQAIIFYPVISPDVGDYYTTIDYEQFYNERHLLVNFTIQNQTQPVITFVLCSEEYLKDDQKCATQEQIDQFYNQIGNQLYMELQYQIVNPDNFEINTISRTYSIIIERTLCSTETVFLQLTKYDLDTGALIATSDIQYHYTDSEDQFQLSSPEYCSKLWLPNTIGVLWLVQQDKLKVEKMVYPKMGEVLAEIGSIVSILFMIKYLMKEVNMWSLKNKILDFLIKIYYPQLQEVQFKKKWGRLSSIKYKNKQINIDSYQEFIKKKRDEISCKLNYMNLLYEVSRIQFILQLSQGRAALKDSHRKGFRLNLRSEGDQFVINNSDSQIAMLEQNGLQGSDAIILSIQQIQKVDQEIVLDSQLNS